MKPIAIAAFSVLVGAIHCSAQSTLVLDDHCTVSILNRTVRVAADGTWVLPNVPAGFGLVRARATCVNDGVVTYGETAPFIIPPNGSLDAPPIFFNQHTPIPATVTVSADTTTFNSAGASVQLHVMAHYADGHSADVTAASSGTTYTISNTSIFTVSPDGLVHAVSSGSVVIQATQEGTSGLIGLGLSLSGDSDGDGIPDDYELAHGMNPNDPTDALQDPDHDGLSNLQEFRLGTDPNKADTDGDGLKDGEEVLRGTNPLLADTDGDGIPDGIEIANGTDPLNASSYNLSKALQSIKVTPPVLNFVVNNINPNVSAQLKVIGTLIDGVTTIDLTSTTRGTNYSSSDLSIANFGVPDGTVFAGAAGNANITVTVGGLSAQIPVTVTTFSPVVSSHFPVPGSLRVDVNGTRVYVAAGTFGVYILDVTDRTNPNLLKTFQPPAAALAVRAVGNYAYVAIGNAGLAIYDVSNPSNPVQNSLVPLPGTAQDIAIRSGFAYVALGAGGMAIVNVSNPAAASLMATLSAGSGKSVIGVDADPSRQLAVMALGGDGMAVADISNPASPVLRGTLPGGQVNKIAIRGNAAYLADTAQSFTAVDITDPAHPVNASSLPFQFGGRLYDVALAGNYAFGADVYFVNGVPVLDISSPLAPAARAIINFPGDTTGTGVAADYAWVYMVADDGYLYIGQYQQVSDNFGIPPTAAIISPAPGTQLIARTTVPVVVQAADDVGVASVQVLVNTVVAGNTSALPYSVGAPIPKGITQVTIGARAFDFGGNVGNAVDQAYPVIVGPLMSVTGSGVDRSNNTMAGAQLNIINEFTATAGSDSRFTIANVPAAIGQFRVYGQLTVNGVVLRGRSALLDPVPNGTVNAGQLIYFPDADWDGLPDDYEAQYSCLNANVADDAADPDGDGLTNFQEYLLGTNPCIPNLTPGRTEVFTNSYSLLNGIRNTTSLTAGLNETDSVAYSLGNCCSAATLPPGFNETFSPVYSLGNGGPPPASLPTGLNETDSDVYSLGNGGAPPTGLPAGLNETVSYVFSLGNGPQPSGSLPAGFNETVSSIYSLGLTLGGRTKPQSSSEAAPNPSSRSMLLAVSSSNERFVEGQTISLRLLNAGAAVRSVEFIADGTSLGLVDAAPFEIALTLPVHVPHIQIRAIAKDSAGQGAGFAVNDLDIWPDSHAAVRGHVADSFGKSLAGVAVHARYHGLRAEFFDFQRPLVDIPSLTGQAVNRAGAVTALNYRNPDRVFGDDPMGSGMIPDFAARFSGQLEIADAGQYRFFLRTQEGARLSINGEKILELPGGGGTVSEGSGEITLEPGLARIEIEYYAAVGGEELDFSYSGPGLGRHAVPQSLLWAESGEVARTTPGGVFAFENLSTAVGSYELFAEGNEESRATVSVVGRENSEVRLKFNAKEK